MSSLSHRVVKTLTPEHKEKIRQSLLGKKHPPERVEKNRVGHLGIKNKNPFFKKGMITWNKGLATPPEVREKQRLSKLIKPTMYWLGRKRPELTGDKNGFWKGGRSTEAESARGSAELRAWRKAVFKRDNYTCQDCKEYKKHFFNAHHIKPFATFPEFRYEVCNGVTLCVPCHKLRHKRK